MTLVSISSYWTIASIIVGTLAILPLVMNLFKNKFEVVGKTILITGASQGMGKAAACQLSAKGANVIIVARNVPKLEAALKEIRALAPNPSSQRFHLISADLTTSEGNVRALEEATSWNNGRAPDIVWCIAGDSYPQFWLETSIDKLRWQMDINYWAAAYMAHTTLQSWLSPTSPNKGSERHFIFTCSALAFYPVTGYATYAPAKAAMRSLSDTMQQEILLYGEDVKIHTVFPGTITSPGLDNENLSKPDVTFLLEKDDPAQSPDEVVAAAIKGLERGEYMIVVNWLGHLMRGLSRGGMPTNFWFLEFLTTIAASLIILVVRRDLDGKVKGWGKKNGHPSGYVKK